MRIAFLTERMILGFGVDLVIDNVASGLVNLGHDVTVFAINIDGTFDDRGYKVKKIPCSLVWNPLKQEYFAYKALPFIKNLETEFDVFLIETFPFYFYPIFLNKPCIIVDHGVSSGVGMDWKTKVRLSYSLITKNIFHLPFVEKIITVSEYLKKTLPFYLQHKTECIHNGVDHYLVNKNLDLDSKKLRKSLGVKENEKLLLYVGRLNHEKQPYKGVNDLVDIYKKALKKNKKIKLLMVGLGDENDKTNLEKYGIKVILKAPVELMPVIFKACDVYVTASKWEGFDLPLIEANSYGRPSICYDIGPHTEVSMKGKSAFIVKTNKIFVEKVLDLCSNKDLYKLMSQGAELNSKRFLWKDIVKKYEKMIKEVVEKSPKNENIDYLEGLVDVIVLNFNGKKYLKNLFESLRIQSYKKIKVTMVDNGSTDGSAEYVKREFPWVNITQSKVNLFFPRGNNLAINQTNGEFIFLLNNDVVIDEYAVEKAMQTMKKDVQIAAVASKMLFAKNKRVIDSIGTVIIPDGSPFNRGIGQFDIGQFDKEEDVFGACFGAVLVRRSFYERKIGPLDNDYYGYFEDVDWCYRARGMGYRIVTSPLSVVFHDHSGTSKKLGYEWKYYLIHRNFIRTLFKNYGNKNLLRYGGKKLLSLIKCVVNSSSNERKTSCLKILANTFFYMPVLLCKRFLVQKRRIKNITDKDIWFYQENQKPFFNGELYEPEYLLENLICSYKRRYEVFGDKFAAKILIKLNDLFVNSKVYDKRGKNKLIKELEGELSKDIGRESAGSFMKKCKDF